MAGLLLLLLCLASLFVLVGGFRFHGFLRGEFLGALNEECVRWPEVALVGGDDSLRSLLLGEGKETLSIAAFGWSGLPEGAMELSVLVGVSLLLSLGVVVHSVLSIVSTVMLCTGVSVSAACTLLIITILSISRLDTGSGKTSAIFHIFRQSK